jgi:hypothetical protein
MIPGPADVLKPLGVAGGAAGWIGRKTLPYIQAAGGLPARAQEAISRVAGYAGESGIISGLQDVGHGTYNPLTVGGDVATGATIGAALHGTGEAVAEGADRIQNARRGGAPLGTPAEIAAANPTNPHAQQFEEWHENIMRGDTPTGDDIKAYAQNRGYGTNMAKWPSPLVNIYNATQPKTLSPMTKLLLHGAVGATQAAAAKTGILENPIVHLGIQGVTAGGEALFDQARALRAPMRVGRAIDEAYPEMVRAYSTGPTRGAGDWRDAYQKLVLGGSQPPP